MSEIESAQTVQTDHASKAVALDSNTQQKASPEESLLPREPFLSRSKRAQTNLDEVLIDSRTFRHAYIVRRPRPLQFYKPKEGVLAPHEREKLAKSNSNDINGYGEERSTDNLLTQLNRLDLFIDLVWVGIIANLSHTYSKLAFTDSGVSAGIVLLEFILLFLPIWRVWDHLRAFGSDFYNDDALQKQFMWWILVLAVVYGIYAPYAFNPEGDGDSLTLLITVYLIARGSFWVAHWMQSFFMPFLRRQFLVMLVSTIITGSLWVPAIWVAYPGKTALLVVANGLEHPIDVLLASPIGESLTTGGWKRVVHVDHYVERLEGFFIIILGEVVFRLIEGSPSGMGIN